MPRSIWKGSIAFGLVHIPVGLYSASGAENLSFTLLDKRNFSPVGYERVNKRTGRKVEWDDIVKGYEIIHLADLLKQSVAQRANEGRGRGRTRRKSKGTTRKARNGRALRKAS